MMSRFDIMEDDSKCSDDIEITLVRLTLSYLRDVAGISWLKVDRQDLSSAVALFLWNSSRTEQARARVQSGTTERCKIMHIGVLPHIHLTHHGHSTP